MTRDKKPQIKKDVVIIGAGAAGLMCAIEAGKRNRSVLVLEHMNKIGKKIRISGGGHCNFTNIYLLPDNYLSANPHFCKSALARFTPHDFIGMVERHGIKYYEKEKGQLFCRGTSGDIVRMLYEECHNAGVEMRMNCRVGSITKAGHFYVSTKFGRIEAGSREKARHVARRHRNALIIAADTIVVLRGRLFGKPSNEEQAKEMLKALSGKAHSVITGFTILDKAGKKEISRSVESKVFFKRLSADEIEAYIRSGEPLDKAGAYGVQGLGAVLIKRIEGDFFNVMGLPLNALTESLKKFGVNVLS